MYYDLLRQKQRQKQRQRHRAQAEAIGISFVFHKQFNSLTVFDNRNRLRDHRPFTCRNTSKNTKEHTCRDYVFQFPVTQFM